MRSAAFVLVVVLRAALAAAQAGAPAPTSDGGLTLERPSSPGPRRAAAKGAWCDGVNHANDNHFDNAFTGGPLIGFEWTPASDANIGRIELYTGELVALNRISLWSDTGGAPSQPLAALGWSDPFQVDMPKTWYGADLLSPVPVLAGTKYWVVWDPEGGEQVSASDDVADAQPTYWGSFAGTVEGGASWNGPFSFADRRWKARMRCAGACESPAMDTAGGVDDGPCNHGIVLAWDPATFPGAGNGAYHVYRSTVGTADALTRPPVAPDVPGPTWIDDQTVGGTTYWYAVQAESLDFPGCGAGPLVGGSTAVAGIGPIEDLEDLIGPSSDVGSAVRAIGYGPDTATFAWFLAPPPGPDESYVVFRSEDRADTGFVEVQRTGDVTWTDLAAVRSLAPRHVWFYDVRLVDACGNPSLD